MTILPRGLNGCLVPQPTRALKLSLSLQTACILLAYLRVVDSYPKSEYSGSANKITCQKMLYFDRCSRKASLVSHVLWQPGGRAGGLWHFIIYSPATIYSTGNCGGIMERRWDWKSGDLSLSPLSPSISCAVQIKLFCFSTRPQWPHM